MELVSGFLLWLLVDVFGIKTIRKESNTYKKVLKAIIFLIAGIIGIVIYFAIFNNFK